MYRAEPIKTNTQTNQENKGENHSKLTGCGSRTEVLACAPRCDSLHGERRLEPPTFTLASQKCRHLVGFGRISIIKAAVLSIIFVFNHRSGQQQFPLVFNFALYWFQTRIKHVFTFIKKHSYIRFYQVAILSSNLIFGSFKVLILFMNSHNCSWVVVLKTFRFLKYKINDKIFSIMY